MAGKMNLELKVGVFAFIAIIILTTTVFSIGEFMFFSPGYSVKVSFGFAAGIDLGAEVRVAGTRVGEIKKLELGYDKDQARAKIILSIFMDEGVEIPRDSRAFISELGLVGERFLEIIPGKDYTDLLKNGEMLIGDDPIPVESLTEVMNKTSNDVGELLGSLNDILDEDIKQDIKDTLHNFKEVSESMKAICQRLESEKVTENLSKAINSMNEVLDIETKQDLKDAISNLNELSKSVSVISGRLERGEGKLGKWLAPKDKD